MLPKEEGDPGCFNVPVVVRKTFMGEALCDLEANGNLMSLSTFNKIGGLVLQMDISLADGNETKQPRMVRDMVIDIEGFKFKFNVIV